MDRVLVTVPDYSVLEDSIVERLITLFQLFNIRIDFQGESWAVSHRYSNLRTLHQSLKSMFPSSTAELPKFPGKSLRTKATGATRSGFLDARREALEAAASKKDIAGSETFKGFLRIVEVDAKNKVFGRSLLEVMNVSVNFGRDIPVVVTDCITYVKTHGLKEVGIFRISAKNSNLCDVKRLYNTGKVADFDSYDDGVHVAAGCFKLFLRELPDCLLTSDRYDEIVSVLEASEDESERVALLIEKLRTLPRPNQALLLELIRLLCAVIEHSETNKMTVMNIVTIFAPTILSRKEAFLDSPDVYKITLLLLQQSKKILGGLTPLPPIAQGRRETDAAVPSFTSTFDEDKLVDMTEGGEAQQRRRNSTGSTALETSPRAQSSLFPEVAEGEGEGVASIEGAQSSGIGGGEKRDDHTEPGGLGGGEAQGGTEGDGGEDRERAESDAIVGTWYDGY